MKLESIILFGALVCAGSIPTTGHAEPASPASARFAGTGLTQSELRQKKSKDPEWEAYVEQRAQMRVLAAELDAALAKVKPTERAKVIQDWKEKNKASLDRFEQKSAAISKRSAPAARLEAPVRKKTSGKPGATVEPGRLNTPATGANGQVDGKLIDGNLPVLPAPNP